MADRMTAPTPEFEKTAALVERAKNYAEPEKCFAKDSPNYELVRSLITALAAVTAERDQARDDAEIWMSNFKEARQMLADAPHADLCKAANGWPSNECDCWKSGLWAR